MPRPPIVARQQSAASIIYRRMLNLTWSPPTSVRNADWAVDAAYGCFIDVCWNRCAQVCTTRQKPAETREYTCNFATITDTSTLNILMPSKTVITSTLCYILLSPARDVVEGRRLWSRSQIIMGTSYIHFQCWTLQMQNSWSTFLINIPHDIYSSPSFRVIHSFIWWTV